MELIIQALLGCYEDQMNLDKQHSLAYSMCAIHITYYCSYVGGT